MMKMTGNHVKVDEITYMAIWEYRPKLGWWIHRSGYHPFHAEQTCKYLNDTMQEWRKKEGWKYEIFPMGVNPNDTAAS